MPPTWSSQKQSPVTAQLERGFFGFFFQAKGPKFLVEFDDAETFRVGDMVGENPGPFFQFGRLDQQRHEIMAKKKIAPKDQANGASVNELLAEGERLADRPPARLNAYLMVRPIDCRLPGGFRSSARPVTC